ncbi:hypothetical protein BH24BAC1_BH24BAC1_14970 [soil metagenome]
MSTNYRNKNGSTKTNSLQGQAIPKVAILLLLLLLFRGEQAAGQTQELEPAMHHLRRGNKPEWDSFAQQPEKRQLMIRFSRARPNETEHTLQLRQQDVKQKWRLVLNGQPLGSLTSDEKDMVVYVPIPPGRLQTGENTLLVEQTDTLTDDIRVGQMVLTERPVSQVLSEAKVTVEVREAGTGQALPARLTVVNAAGALQTVGAASGQLLAVRPGFVYTGNGRASFGLPAGTYTVYASRGFAYGVDSVRLVLQPGEEARPALVLRREVPTEGWISSDTHVHTFTYSRHGDATVEERVLSIAGEGLDLPVMTDHNLHVDLAPVAEKMGMASWFTPVIGNEVTTPVGHFNVFPVAAGASPPDHRGTDWEAVGRNMKSLEGNKAVILNHARDVHSGFRPFGPERHLAASGLNLDAWPLPANAMEVINSGATQTDGRQLYRDWFGMLNRGRNENPAQVDVQEAVQNFRDGKVMVSFGLLAELVVDGKYGPGELAPTSDQVAVSVRVLGPGWTKAERVTLYANGHKIQEALIPEAEGNKPGVKWTGSWVLPRPIHDVHLVAVAEGPGRHLPFWPIAKPYQPASPTWEPRVFGSSGAVWVDADGDGAPTSAHAYALKLVADAKERPRSLLRKLAPYDEAVAMQAAALLQERGVAPDGPEMTRALRKATPATKQGVEQFASEWKASQAVRARR